MLKKKTTSKIKKRTFAGNDQLKAAGVKIPWPKDRLEEYNRCAQDPFYFMEKYYKIMHPDHGLITFKFRPFQRELIEKIHGNGRVIAKCSRQTGKSTAVIGYFLWTVLFNPMVWLAMTANKGEIARELLSRLQLAYEHIPFWLQQGVVAWAKGSIELENGSKIMAASTTSASIRGKTFNIVWIDEFAAIQRNLAHKFYTSTYPAISAGQTTKCVITSTANGMNLFYKFLMDAVNKLNDYIILSADWRAVPERDEKWKENEIKNMGKDEFRQEHECEFLGSANTLISPEILKEMVYIQPMKEEGNLKIYTTPQKDHTYIICVDVGKGRGQDSSSFSVIDISGLPYEQVAIYQDNTIQAMLYPNYIVAAAREYNDAYVLVEYNDIGAQVADILWYDLGYENLLMTYKDPVRANQMSLGLGMTKTSKLGLEMSRKTKALGCSNLKTLMDGQKLLVHDFETISQLSVFVAKGVSFEAEEGAHDDAVMSLVNFGWASSQPFFRELSQTDVRKNLSNQEGREDEDFASLFDFNTEEPEEELWTQAERCGSF